MKPFRSLVALAFVTGAAGAVGPAGAACAGEGARAALVVDTGAAVTAYCVALPDESVTGIELVQLAGEQHGLDYSLGFGGEAVCRLEGVGPDGDDCFGEYPEFWGYWHGNGSGGWTWAGTGAGSASIEDGDVDGWSWGAGDNGSNHQQPPAKQFSDVCAVATASPATQPDRARERPRSGGGGAQPRSTAAAPAPSPDAVAAPAEPQGERPGRRRARGGRDGPPPSAAPAAAALAPTPEPPALSAQPAADGDEGAGPPVAGLAGLGATAVLAAVVWAGTRRRSRV